MLQKLAFATLPFFSIADYSNVAETFPKLVDEFCSNPANQKLEICSDIERSFGSSWAQEIIQSINGYGCWCYFQDNHGSGRGLPVNEVDNQCKILHDGYTCILMDAEFESQNCTPWDVQYNSATGLGLLADDSERNSSLEEALRLKCKRANKKSNCAARACMVENYFVVRMFRLFLQGVTFDPTVKHSIGIFDPKKDCPIKDGLKSDKACCGDYPLRFPYKSLNGDRGCCVDKTFNAAALVCCEDGSIKITCS